MLVDDLARFLVGPLSHRNLHGPFHSARPTEESNLDDQTDSWDICFTTCASDLNNRLRVAHENGSFFELLIGQGVYFPFKHPLPWSFVLLTVIMAKNPNWLVAGTGFEPAI